MSWASEWREANAKGVRRSRAQIQAQARQGTGPVTLPFLPGITAATLADMPDGCACTWVPVFEGSPAEGYQATGGWRLKFVSRCCPVPAHQAVRA